MLMNRQFCQRTADHLTRVGRLISLRDCRGLGVIPRRKVMARSHDQFGPNTSSRRVTTRSWASSSWWYTKVECRRPSTSEVVRDQTSPRPAANGPPDKSNPFDNALR